LVAPTTSMNAAALAEREKALECMRLTLFLKIIKVFCKY
jgi:hypothetical protein